MIHKMKYKNLFYILVANDKEITEISDKNNSLNTSKPIVFVLIDLFCFFIQKLYIYKN